MIRRALVVGMLSTAALAEELSWKRVLSEEGVRDARIVKVMDEVRRSDVLVILMGHLYGTIVPRRNISFTWICCHSIHSF